MNGFMNPLCDTPPYRSFVKMTDLTDPPPARNMVLIDERAESLNNGVFSVDMTESRIFDWPANYHSNASALAFADGRSELKRWRDPRTTPRALKGEPLQTGRTDSPGNPDVVWLQERTTAKMDSP